MVMEEWLDSCLDATEMREIDSWAIEACGIPSLDLMEVAGFALADKAVALAGDGRCVAVCGKGNNGGDGLVAARRLDQLGLDCSVVVLGDPAELSPDSARNLELLDGGLVHSADDLEDVLTGASLVIDAIFGTGFSGEPRGDAAAAIGLINASSASVVSADLPSGVNASTGEVEGEAIRADATVTFHAPKIGHLISPGKRHAGELTVADIGIPDGAPVEAAAGVISERVLELPPRRGPSSTKFSSGRVVVVGGSRGLTGAVCLASEASARGGAGYVTAAVPADLERIFEAKLTEVMTIGCASRDGVLRAAAADQVVSATDGAAAVLLGPGLGRGQGAARLARDLVERIASPLVIDADALFALSKRLEGIAGRAAPTVITPHTGEMARLLGVDSAEVEGSRLESAKAAAEASGAVTVLKGDDTLIVDGDRLAINALPSPGLATAGTGDVLAGLVSALIARGSEPFEAACAAVIAHSRAGADAASRLGAESVMASDVIDSIPIGLGYA